MRYDFHLYGVCLLVTRFTVFCNVLEFWAIITAEVWICIDMGYMRNVGPNRNGHRKSSTIIVGQRTPYRRCRRKSRGLWGQYPCRACSLPNHSRDARDEGEFEARRQRIFCSRLTNMNAAKRHTAWHRLFIRPRLLMRTGRVHLLLYISPLIPNWRESEE